MAVSVVGTPLTASIKTTGALVFASVSVLSGDRIIVIFESTTSPATCSDNLGNSFDSNTSGGPEFVFSHVYNASGTPVVTVTNTAGSAKAAVLFVIRGGNTTAGFSSTLGTAVNVSYLSNSGQNFNSSGGFLNGGIAIEAACTQGPSGDAYTDDATWVTPSFKAGTTGAGATSNRTVYAQYKLPTTTTNFGWGGSGPSRTITWTSVQIAAPSAPVVSSGAIALAMATSLAAAGNAGPTVTLTAATSLTADAVVEEFGSKALTLTSALTATGTVPATPPTNIYAAGTPNTTTSMDVSWDSQGSGVTYDVDRSTDQSTWTNVATATSSTSLTDGSRTADTQYYYRVRATNFVGTSAYAQTSGRTGKSVTLTTPVNLGSSELAVGGVQNWFLTVPVGSRIPTGGSVLLVVSLSPDHNVDALRGGDAHPIGAHDDAGNRYKMVSRSTANNLDGQLYVLYCPVVAFTLLPGDTITIDHDGSSAFGSIVGLGFSGNLANLNVDAASSSVQAMSRTTNTFTVTGGQEVMGWAKYWQLTTGTTNPSSAVGWTTGVTDTYQNASGFTFQTFARLDYETGYNGTAVTDSMSFAEGGGADWWALYATIVPIGASPVVEINQSGAGGINLIAATALLFQSPGNDTTPINDSFNRANQSGLGTADDGGTYTVDTGIAASISGNTAIITTGRNVFTETNFTSEEIVHRDVGTASMDVTWHIAANSLAGSSYKKMWLAYDPSTGGGIMLAHTNGALTGNLYIDFKPGVSGNANFNTLWDSGISLTDGLAHTFRARYDSDKKDVQVWVDGTSIVDYPLTGATPFTGTHAGFVSTQANSVDGFAVDSWSATRLLPAIIVAAPPVNATLAAITALTAAGIVTELAGAALLAATTVVAAATVVKDAGTASLVATTTFATSALVTVQATASLVATTSLTIAAFVQEFAGSGLSAVTTLSASASVTEIAASSLTASTSLTAAGFVQELGAAGLTAVTTLVVSGIRGVPGASSLIAATTLTVAGSVTELATANLVAVTSLSVSAFVQEQGLAALSAQTSLSAAGATQELAVAALSAATTLTAAAQVTELAAATLSAVTSLTVTAFLQIGTGAASLTAVTSLTAAGATQEQGVAVLTAATTLSATGGTQAGASAGLTLGTALTSAGFTQELAQAALTAATSLTTTGVRGVPGSATLVAATSLTTAGQVTELAASALTAATSLSAPGVVGRLGVAGLVAATALTASGSVTELATATLVATTSLGAGAVDTVFALAALSASTSLSTVGSVTELAVATLTAATSLSTSGSVTERATASLTATTALSASALVVEQAVAALTAATVLTVAAAVMEQAAVGLTMDTGLAADGSATTLSGAVTLQMLTTLSVVANVFGALRDIQVLLGGLYDPIALGEQALAIAFDLAYDHISIGLPVLPVVLFGEVVDPVAVGERQEVAAVGDPYDPITLGDSGL